MTNTQLAPAPKTQPATDRSTAIDIVRVLGIVAIVVGHVWGNEEWAKSWLYTWHVPVFFVITGYLWKPNRSSSDELRRRTKTLLVPYIAWLVIVTVTYQGVLLYQGQPATGGLLGNLALGGWWIARPYSAFWFVTALFFAAIGMRWLQNISPFLPWFIGALGILWATTDPVGIKQVPQAAGLALPAIAFICAGYALRRYRSRITHPLAFGLTLLMPALILGGTNALESLNMKSGLLGDPLAGVFMATAIGCGLILTAEALEAHVPGWMRRGSTVLATTALPVILTHTLVLLLLAPSGNDNNMVGFLLAYLVPTIGALIIRLTPARRLLL